MKTLFVSVLKLYVPLALCSFLSCVGAEQCGVMKTFSGQGDYRASLDNIMADFKAKCRKKTLVSTGSITTATQVITVTTSSGWPLGHYGLPMPSSGCPAAAGDGFTWQTGFRTHDTDDADAHNEWSTTLHLYEDYGVDDMTQHFCIKTENPGTEDGIEWPVGNYCVFKYGENCPNNQMLSGSISWDDEDNINQNKVQGTVPAGVYDQDTRIDYCCMTGGNSSQPISLPTQNPFYLFPYSSQECQAVEGMVATEEYFTWDQDSWNGKASQGNHPYRIIGDGKLKIGYCYYWAA